MSDTNVSFKHLCSPVAGGPAIVCDAAPKCSCGCGFVLTNSVRGPICAMRTSSYYNNVCEHNLYLSPCAETGRSGLSLRSDHVEERHLCLNRFAEIYGEMPLMYSSIAAVQYNQAQELPKGMPIVHNLSMNVV